MRLKAVLCYAGVAAAVAAALVVTLRPGERRPEIPFGYEAEAIEISSPQFTDAVTAVPDDTACRRTAFLPARRRLKIHSGPDRLPSSEEPCFHLVDFQATDAGPTPELEASAEEAADEGE